MDDEMTVVNPIMLAAEMTGALTAAGMKYAGVPMKNALNTAEHSHTWSIPDGESEKFMQVISSSHAVLLNWL